MTASVRFLGRAGWSDGVIEVTGGAIRVRESRPEDAGLPPLDGVVTGGFTDAHVHLQLVDATRFTDSVLGRVTDLGGDPAVLEELCTTPPVQIAFAGAFLTPPGGYPSDRAWAPAGSVREITDAQDARAAVAEMKTAGATCIKVACNSTAGPVFSDALLSAIVDAAAAAGLPVTAHAEGQGEAQRAARLGARRLAHAPFSERLTDADLTRMRDAVCWVSTLAIHEGTTRDTAIDNVRRFHALGGTILYGTDMGNGPTPVGLNAAEIDALREAGITGADLLRTLTPQDPTDPASRLLFHPGAAPETADPLHARLLTAADLEIR